MSSLQMSGMTPLLIGQRSVHLQIPDQQNQNLQLPLHSSPSPPSAACTKSSWALEHSVCQVRLTHTSWTLNLHQVHTQFIPDSDPDQVPSSGVKGHLGHMTVLICRKHNFLISSFVLLRHTHTHLSLHTVCDQF